ncbi:MAG: NlpC/P60 family protein [Coriobacteriia bacterium]|nr:NlpC/P60 family protein [Coriobacteriia bacterium]
MPRHSGRPVGIPLIVCALAVCLVAPVSAFAVPSTPQIRAKRADAAAAAKQLADLDDELEVTREDYAVVSEALQSTRERIVATEEQLAEAEARLAESQEVLAQRVRAIYRGGSVDMIEVLLGTSSFDDFLTRLDILNRITGSDTDLVADMAGDRTRVAAARASLENRESEQTALRAEVASKKLVVERAVAKQRAFVTSLDREVAKLVKDESARLARVAAEAARQAALRGAADKPSDRTTDLSKLGASHGNALSVARRYLGVPYLWGGTTPSGFDCSGLMQYAYRETGISLPRTSRSQYRIGAFIPADRLDLLEPGDLVFFGYGGDSRRVHHVGMYAGNNVFLHAPGTGDHVKYSSLTERISSRGDYVGAVRP